jgi:signal recognition particle subunit SRP14
LAPSDTISPLLVRATNGNKDKSKKIKLTTVVSADDLDKFFTRYADVCKANMGSLKKRDRKKRKEKLRKKEKAPAATTAA